MKTHLIVGHILHGRVDVEDSHDKSLASGHDTHKHTALHTQLTTKLRSWVAVMA
jgi:hypothetical protein